MVKSTAPLLFLVLFLSAPAFGKCLGTINFQYGDELSSALKIADFGKCDPKELTDLKEILANEIKEGLQMLDRAENRISYNAASAYLANARASLNAVTLEEMKRK